jgi:soluble lytic murein transglycosylase-like protein
LVTQEARSFLLDPRLVLAVIRAESGFDPLARSAKNAMGLMQLIPETAHRFNVADPLDPLQNVRGGMSYLRWLLAYYRGDVVLVLAAYNAGEGAVDRHRGVPPFAETIGYVQRIRALYPFDRHPFDRKALASGERTWLDRGMANTQR